MERSVEKECLKLLLIDCISKLCRCGIDHTESLKVEGLLAVTIDNGDVMVVSINKEYGAKEPDENCDVSSENVELSKEYHSFAVTTVPDEKQKSESGLGDYKSSDDIPVPEIKENSETFSEEDQSFDVIPVPETEQKSDLGLNDSRSSDVIPVPAETQKSESNLDENQATDDISVSDRKQKSELDLIEYESSDVTSVPKVKQKLDSDSGLIEDQSSDVISGLEVKQKPESGLNEFTDDILLPEEKQKSESDLKNISEQQSLPPEIPKSETSLSESSDVMMVTEVKQKSELDLDEYQSTDDITVSEGLQTSETGLCENQSSDVIPVSLVKQKTESVLHLSSEYPSSDNDLIPSSMNQTPESEQLPCSNTKKRKRSNSELCQNEKNGVLNQTLEELKEENNEECSPFSYCDETVDEANIYLDQNAMEVTGGESQECESNISFYDDNNLIEPQKEEESRKEFMAGPPCDGNSSGPGVLETQLEISSAIIDYGGKLATRKSFTKKPWKISHKPLCKCCVVLQRKMKHSKICYSQKLTNEQKRKRIKLLVSGDLSDKFDLPGGDFNVGTRVYFKDDDHKDLCDCCVALQDFRGREKAKQAGYSCKS